jgi:hypothetical protein
MTTMTMERRLAELSLHIEALAARSRSGDEVSSRMQRHLAALRQHEAHARAAIGETPEEIDRTLAQLEVRLDIAGHSLTADAANNPSTFTSAVDQELRSWDAYLERLQTSAVARAGRAREQAEARIGELRRQRLEVGRRLAELRAGSPDAWRQLETRVTAAREQLEHEADDLSEKFEYRKQQGGMT